MSHRRPRIAILADFPWSFFAEGATGHGGGQSSTWLPQLALEYANGTPYDLHWVSLDRRRMFGRVSRREWGGQQFASIPAGKVRVDLALGYGVSRWLLSRELARIEPDLIHCWGTEQSYPVVSGEFGTPSILSMQGVLTHLEKRGCLPDTWFWRRAVGLEPGFLQRADVITCESQWASDRVLEILTGADVREVEYGVHPSFYDMRWEPDESQPYAVFIGTLTRGKGVPALLEALRTLGHRRWGFKFIGDGPLIEQVRRCDIPGVECLGRLRWTTLQQVLRRASCLVHPTLADSSPNVVKEARVVGLPVITTPHGGQVGYIHDDENGLIVDPLAPGALAAAMERVMANPALARRLGATRHAEDRAYFRASETARKFLSVYNDLLAK